MSTSLTELEQLQAVAAYIVMRHGDAYMPTFERLEQEIADVRRDTSNRERARSVLSSLMKKGVTNASVA